MEKEWIIEFNELENDELLKNESIFNTANGYIGVRGNFEEGYKKEYTTVHGTFLNAFYDLVPIKYGEKAYAFPEIMEKLVNVIDTQKIDLLLGDEKFSLFEGELKSFRRYLDMKSGIYKREIHWISLKGKEAKINITRMASLNRLELFVINYEVERLNFDDEITIVSYVNGDVKNYTNENDPRVGGEFAKLLRVKDVEIKNDFMQITSKTLTSNALMSATSYNKTNNSCKREFVQAEEEIKEVIKFNNEKKISLTKYNIYSDSFRHKDPKEKGYKLLKELVQVDFETLKLEQKEYLDDFWKIADIEIDGDLSLQQGLRYNLYQLLQSAGKDDISNIAAKGLSGEGYEGHYFWDTEIYILPFFNLCNPKLAKNLLKYRYSILDSARKRAIEMGHKKGAAYPWRTIAGRECSGYFPAGTAQYHINADIAYSYIQHYLVTKDIEFIKEFGAEVLFETARIWIEIGHFYNNEFRIDDVTGPDEYTAIVNNNFYTNSLAKYNLNWAAKIYELLEKEDKPKLRELCNKINLENNEVSLWKEASEKMYLPYDEDLNIDAQDDTFLKKEVWDFKGTGKDKYPLLLNYHPLTIYRYQVLKQADTVLAHFLLDGISPMDRVKNSYDYYEKITTHDSSLSCAVYSIMASKVGYKEKAYDYFIETARLDLDNTHSNTKDGIHTANMGGTWMSIVFGFGGLRIKEEGIMLNPKLPENWNKLSFKFKYKSSIVSVNIEGNILNLSLDGEDSILLIIEEKNFNLTKENNKLRYEMEAK